MCNKVINYDTTTVESYFKSENWDELINYFKTAFKLELNSENQPKKLEFQPEALDNLLELLQLLRITDKNPKKFEVITEIFRSLRNCSIDRTTQDYLVKPDHISLFKDYFTLFQINNTDASNCFKIFLQFLINLIVFNENTSKIVYTELFSQIQSLLGQVDKNIYEISAIYYNLCLGNGYEIIKLKDATNILILFEKHVENEYLQFIIENLIKSDIFWADYFENIEINCRIISLEYLRHILLKNKNYTIPNHSLSILKSKFTNCSEIVFQTNDPNNNLAAYECSLILEIISSLSSREGYLETFQNKDILITAGILLINIHKLGKLSDNCFSAVQKLSEIRSPNEEIRNHPAFAFKADLIRLIGNLCWKSKDMQNLARTAEIIPVLLDCCNIDARNPFIIQWVILAVRNLCEGNLENQKLITEMHQQGVVPSAVLKEMGITLNDDGGNQLNIVPLDNLKQFQNSNK